MVLTAARVIQCVIILAIAHVNKAKVDTLVEGIAVPNRDGIIEEANNDIGQRTSITDLYHDGSKSTQTSKLDTVISMLEGLQLQVNRLKASVDKLQKNETVLKPDCPASLQIKHQGKNLVFQFRVFANFEF